MKKIVLFITFATAFCTGINAQETIQNDGTGGSFDMSYQAIDGGFGLGLTWVANYLVINASFLQGDTDANIKKNEGWRAGIGGNYRYWFSNAIFAEAQAGVEYTHVSQEYNYNGYTNKDSDGNVGLFFTPRLGAKLFTVSDINVGVVAGYRWDFNKFKFKKEYTDDYFTIGIIAVM